LKTVVLIFVLSGTVMLLWTDLTSAPDDKSIGVEYCQKILWYCTRKVSSIYAAILEKCHRYYC